MPSTFVSGKEYKGTQSYDGKWAGTGFYPEATLPYFDFYFKGKQAEHTGYMPNEVLLTTLTTNSPDIKVLDVERRNLDSETMGAIMNCLLGNTQVTELKIARNVAFWSEQPDDFGIALAQVLADPTCNITKVRCLRRRGQTAASELTRHANRPMPDCAQVDIKNNDIHEEAIAKLMSALQTNTKVTWLDMSDNFSRGQGKAIGEMLKVNKTLTYLNLNVNQLTDEDALEVLAGVDANTTLKYFSAYNNGAVEPATRKRLRGFNKL